MALSRVAVIAVIVSIANITCASASRAFEFDKECIELRQKLAEASGTPEEVAEETETDPRLLTALLRDEKYVCTPADKDYLARQVAKDAKIVAHLEQIVAKCPQYIDPEPLRKQLTGDDAKPDSEANEILSGFSETKRFLSFAKEAQKLHLKASGICDGKQR